jgi:predicted phage terminase large subunit-like protein
MTNIKVRNPKLPPRVEATCRACHITKAKKYFNDITTEVCALCEEVERAAKQLAEKSQQPRELPASILRTNLPEPVPKTLDVDASGETVNVFPTVELNINDPSVKEMAARTLARRKLVHFIRRFRPKYQVGWVHEDICRRLERFMDDVANGLSPRLLLMMPPRAGKSEIGSRHFVPFALGHHPDWEIIAASHTGALTMSFSRYIRDLMRDPSYHSLFPGATLDPKSQSVENWNLLQGGGYLAAGVGTGITGRGAHILLLDDLVKDIEAADSQLQRDGTWEWYASTAYTRLAPGAGVLGIMTWWNEDDWAGRIQQVMAAGEGDQFEIVRYPAINDLGDEYLLEDDTIVQIHPDDIVPENARMTRPMGTAIHPDRYTTEAMLRIKRNMVASGQKRLWDSLYQQNPTPDEGIYFSKAMFREYAHTPSRLNVRIYQAWDFAITTGQASDYTVGVTLLHDEHDNIYVLDVTRFRSGDGEDIVHTIIQYAQDWGVDSAGVDGLGFEDGQIWKSIHSTFTRVCQEKKFYPSYELLKPLTDKQVRAQPLRGRMQAGKIWFPVAAPWYGELQRELLRFPAGKHDDQVDALSWAVRLVLAKSVPTSPQPKKLKSWRDKIRINSRGSGHMVA